jgi:DNA-binding XRE family transcriptional regulator
VNIQGNYYLQDKKKIKREIELSIRAKYLKELRVKIKKTQKEVALEANVSVNAIRLMEAGETF